MYTMQFLNLFKYHYNSNNNAGQCTQVIVIAPLHTVFECIGEG